MSAPRRHRGETATMILAAIGREPLHAKQIAHELAPLARSSCSRLLAGLRRDGLISHGYVLTDAGRAKLEGK